MSTSTPLPASETFPAGPAPSPDRAALIARVQALARELGRRPVTRQIFTRRTRVPTSQIIRHFGSFGGLLQAAGFKPFYRNARVDDDALLRTLRDVCRDKGGVVSREDFVRADRRGPAPYRRRWRNWPATLAALRVWVEANDPDFPYLEDLPLASELPPPPVIRPAPGRRYGAPMNFRGILHEPVNEPGVILLFGVLAHDLGFGIESVHASFPDCEAKRRTGVDTWERVRIEFEFESRNFKVHGHDAAECDLIVCWAHTWPDCPLPVLELRAEVEKRRHEVPPQVLPAWVRGAAPRPSALEERPRVRQTVAVMD